MPVSVEALLRQILDRLEVIESELDAIMERLTDADQ